jgi:dipeptidyl aminopeptidase/acylaminoacyl peptidase
MMRILPREPGLLAAGLVIGAAAAGAWETKRPFTLEDLYRLEVVADPAVSPDGRTIAYSVTVSDLKAAKRTVNLWRVDPGGKSARRLTVSEARDESPRFSPDGTRLAFVSTRAGSAQLHLLPMAGGEAEKKTDFPGGIAGPVWSPDGRRIAFAADVYPECGADAACNRKLDEAREKGKLKAHVADRLLYRHWDHWKDGKRTHVLVLDLEKGTVHDLTPGDHDAPTFSLGGPLGYAFSPDSKELAFVSNHDPDEASSTNADIWTVPVEGTAAELASPRNLTGGNPAWDGSPAYSPDGRYLAYRTQKIPGYESDRFRLALHDRKAGTTRALTEQFDNWVNDLRWTADSRRILFTADVKGRTPLHELDVATGRIRVVSAVGAIDSFEVSPDGTWVVAARRRIGSPHELHRLPLTPAGGKEETRLTMHNMAVEAEVDIRPAEEMYVAGAGGRPVQVFVVKPSGFDPKKKYPLILNIHGGPQMMWADSFRGDWQVYPGAGYVVAFPNPHGSTGFGQEFTAAISRDYDGKVMEDIAKVTDAVAALPYVDADRLGVMGWSWGGYAVMWLEGHTDRFKAAASMMGVYDLRAQFSATEELWFPRWDHGGAPWENLDFYRRASPSEHVKGFKTPCLVITGQKDFRVPYTQSLAFFTDLQERKVPSRLIVFENAGHWPAWNEMALYYAAHLDWFHRYLGGGPSPWDPVEIARNRAFVTVTGEAGKK